jgi:hypothetical protein
LFEFLQQPIAAPELRPFRALPTYDDHYSDRQRRYVYRLVKRVASAETWNLVHQYFDGTDKKATIIQSKHRKLETLVDVKES